jgi:hypothetical protein
MKLLYWTIFVSCFGFLLLGIVVTYSIPPEEFAAREFARKPETWNLVLKDQTDSSIYIQQYEEMQKEKIITFIRKNPSPSKSNRDQIDLIALIMMLFALIGWMREKNFQKYKTANAK